MRDVIGQIAARLVGAGILALTIACEENSGPGSDDEVRILLNNTSPAAVSVAIVTSHGTTTVPVAASAQEAVEVTGRVGQQITFQVSAPGSVGNTSCMPNSVIVTPVNTSPLPGALYGQVDITVTTPTIQVSCSGGLGEWQ